MIIAYAVILGAGHQLWVYPFLWQQIVFLLLGVVLVLLRGRHLSCPLLVVELAQICIFLGGLIRCQSFF